MSADDELSNKDIASLAVATARYLRSGHEFDTIGEVAQFLVEQAVNPDLSPDEITIADGGAVTTDTVTRQIAKMLEPDELGAAVDVTPSAPEVPETGGDLATRAHITAERPDGTTGREPRLARRERWCAACKRRVTVSPDGDKEYGHSHYCEHWRDWVDDTEETGARGPDSADGDETDGGAEEPEETVTVTADPPYFLTERGGTYHLTDSCNQVYEVADRLDDEADIPDGLEVCEWCQGHAVKETVAEETDQETFFANASRSDTYHLFTGCHYLGDAVTELTDEQVEGRELCGFCAARATRGGDDE